MKDYGETTRKLFKHSLFLDIVKRRSVLQPDLVSFDVFPSNVVKKDSIDIRPYRLVISFAPKCPLLDKSPDSIKDIFVAILIGPTAPDPLGSLNLL